MSGVRVAVTGATGRMGGSVRTVAAERGHEVVAVTETAPMDLSGPGADETFAASDLRAALSAVDVLVDFTVPEASVEYVETAAEAGVPCVVGTTGFGEEGISRLREASERAAVLRAANFARGVQALLRAVGAAVEALPGYDVELTETHHNGKRDAPSGTALTILDEIDAAREDDPERVYGREGHHPREPGEVGVHVRRAGDVRGEHEVLVAGNEEVLELTHRVEDRDVWAAGALDAAEWLVDRDPGYYGFADLLDGEET
ncbi:MAG: 4-hydroxy-tetrahydrodipicolinate reductase [Haloarculaceae archaeon]